MQVVEVGRWNHNVEYYGLVLEAVPVGALHALDVGCGEGSLCRALRKRVPHVVGIDVDASSIAQARSAAGDIEYRHGDFLSEPFPPASFDVIASVASLHHMNIESALARMRDLLAHGGSLVIVGVPRRSVTDLPFDGVGFFAHRYLKWRRGYWEHSSPTVDPAYTYRQVRALVRRTLPGAQVQRHVLFRFSVVWRRP